LFPKFCYKRAPPAIPVLVEVDCDCCYII